ncbi:MAG: iron-only hydrogenase system regulator [Clostridiales bacterium]|nr:iron-only hydrogenase system regulator [Clostridiales bacterium]
MDKQLAVIAIVVEKEESVEALNSLLHEFREYVIGRMGIPHKERGISLISLAVDGPVDMINALSGKIGRLPGVSSKTAYSKVQD